MKKLIFGSLIFLLPGSFVFAKETPHKPLISIPQSYTDWMKQGFSLENRRQWTQAEAAFVQALSLQPNDPNALLEQGWVVFQQGQFERALHITKQALTKAAQPQQKAAAFYNLGRIYEEQKHKDEAIQSYKASLQLRNHPTVRTRLANLDPTYASTQKLVAKWLYGPHKTEMELCDYGILPRFNTENKLEKPRTGDVCGSNSIPLRAQVTGNLPFLALLSSKVTEGLSSDTASYYLAIRTPSGWYYRELLTSTSGTYSTRYFKERFEFTPTEAFAQSVPGHQHPLLFFSYQTTSIHELGAYEQPQDKNSQQIERFLMICSVDNTNRPSCLDPITVFYQEDKKVLIDVKATIQPNGRLLLSGKAQANDERSTRNLLGEYTLDFSKESMDAAETEAFMKEFRLKHPSQEQPKNPKE